MLLNRSSLTDVLGLAALLTLERGTSGEEAEEHVMTLGGGRGRK